MKIISRAEAKALGLKRYFTGKPCKHGHMSERTTKSRKCTKCHAERGIRWARMNRAKATEVETRSRKKNPEKYRKINRDYQRKISDLIAVLRTEMPDLLKEFGL